MAQISSSHGRMVVTARKMVPMRFVRARSKKWEVSDE